MFRWRSDRIPLPDRSSDTRYTAGLECLTDSGGPPEVEYSTETDCSVNTDCFPDNPEKSACFPDQTPCWGQSRFLCCKFHWKPECSALSEMLVYPWTGKYYWYCRNSCCPYYTSCFCCCNPSKSPECFLTARRNYCRQANKFVWNTPAVTTQHFQLLWFDSWLSGYFRFCLTEPLPLTESVVTEDPADNPRADCRSYCLKNEIPEPGIPRLPNPSPMGMICTLLPEQGSWFSGGGLNCRSSSSLGVLTEEAFGLDSKGL